MKNNDITRNRQENRWGYTNSYYPNQNSYTYQRSYEQNRYQDRYDDLKTSAFYNESYKNLRRAIKRLDCTNANCSPYKLTSDRRYCGGLFHLWTPTKI